MKITPTEIIVTVAIICASVAFYDAHLVSLCAHTDAYKMGYKVCDREYINNTFVP